MIQQWSEKLNNIESKLDKLQINMDEIQYLLSEMKSNLPKSYEMLYPKKHTIKKKKVIIDNRTKWRREVYRQIRILISKDCPYKKRSEVLHYIYNYMRKNYGIVWEQDIKEYKEQFEIDYKPKTIDIVYNDKTYKSIFEAILFDLIENSWGIIKIDGEIKLEDKNKNEVINLLLSKENDITNQFHNTIREILRLGYNTKRGKEEIHKLILFSKSSLDEIEYRIRNIENNK